MNLLRFQNTRIVAFDVKPETMTTGHPGPNAMLVNWNNIANVEAYSKTSGQAEKIDRLVINYSNGTAPTTIEGPQYCENFLTALERSIQFQSQSQPTGRTAPAAS